MDEKEIMLEVDHLSKTFRSKKGACEKVLEDISFSVKKNEFLVILGPGLCGKTVLLNILMGLMKADSGTIRIEGQAVKSTEARQKFGMVFQKIGLMPWKTVRDNVELGQKFHGMRAAERHELSQKYIELVGLQGFEENYPDQLSGGMKQRVGIARAYTNNPEVLIMDEPFGQLDAQTRYFMQNELQKIWEKEKRTVVFVTNNIEEACSLGDRIILLSQCPTKVKNVFEIDLPHPRDTLNERFLQSRKKVSEEMDLYL